MDFQVKKGGIVSDLIKKANLIQKKKKYKKFCTKTAPKTAYSENDQQETAHIYCAVDVTTYRRRSRCHRRCARVISVMIRAA